MPDIYLPNGLSVPGNPPAQTNVTRQTFLSGFLANLGPSLEGAMRAPRGSGIAGGIGGGFAGIAEEQDKQLKQSLQRAADQRAAAAAEGARSYQQALTQHVGYENQAAALDVQNKKNEFDYLMGRNPAQPPPFMSLAPGAQADTGLYGIDAHVTALDKSLHLLPEERAAIYNARDEALRSGNPAIAHKALADVVASRGKPETAAYSELRNKGLSPLQAQERLKTLTQHDPITAFGQWHQAFVSETGKEPNRAEILAYQRSVAPSAATAGTSRSDKSYQYNNGELDKLQNPIDTAVQRLGRLQDTLDQKSPQADALIAPELLTVMAGGAGSGLRMNEAEISRIVGGRSNWESLKAAANKWSLDPKEARSITPEQDTQIRALVSEVNNKLLAKQKALQEARDSLLNSDDPKIHRQAVNDARQRLLGIDSGSSGGLKLKRVSPNVVVEQ